MARVRVRLSDARREAVEEMCMVGAKLTFCCFTVFRGAWVGTKKFTKTVVVSIHVLISSSNCRRPFRTPHTKPIWEGRL